ncbi:MAG: hypothetical protein CMM58_12895 [Rhodospirillaceae bacterium]|nr:hypothetical protein [Rhodospirillaceae bacterium]|tara:strand:+ start:149 stop:919 length:771 start_codon:yes stop_codon:yes gene_type:complete
MNRLKNKVAIVTGGANGIGRAICKRFLEEGARVIVADLSEDSGNSLVSEVGENAVFYKLDVSNPTEWNELSDYVLNNHEKLDILINNAGILSTSNYQSIEHVDLDEWRAVQLVNVEGVFLGCQAAVNAMRERGGVIVNMSSVAGLIASPAIVAYGASKGAVRQLTKSIAIDCARKGYRIRCNSVHPGFIDTELGRDSMNLGGGDPEKNYKNRVALTPMGVPGEPLDIANAVLFLASDEAKHITGSELVVDGGLTAV